MLRHAHFGSKGGEPTFAARCTKVGYTRELSTCMAKSQPNKAKALNNVRTWEAVERGARSERAFVTTSQDWDRDQYLLGTPGGRLNCAPANCGPASPLT
jgi:hypothetical protein